MDEVPDNPSRWLLIRQGIIFQLKLGLDAIRDVLLSPVSIILVIYDVLAGRDQTQSYFVKLMKYGRQSDRWINLFGLDDLEEKQGNNSVDYWLEKVEKAIKEQQKEGEISQTVRDKLEKYLSKAAEDEKAK